MKVTALIPDQLVEEVRTLSEGKNTTDSLIIALREWTEIKKISQLNEKVKERPLQFGSDFDAASVRSINRRR